MKKSGLFLILLLIFIAYGCGEDAVEVIDAPEDLSIASADGLEITFNWVESETADIDGYIFYLDNVAFDTVTTVSSAKVTPSGLGTITIKAYKEDDLSDASNSVTTSVVTGTDLTIYDFDIAGQPSGVGWDEDGNSTIYNFTAANEDSIDLYLDTDFFIASPATYVPVKWNTAKIQQVHSDVDYAPESGYGNAEYPYADSIYVVRLPGHGGEGGDQYIKITVTNVVTDDNITFDYTFQSLDDYTRFK